MAVDAPARIAILGAGPIGLEAALYARFLGYEVDLFERDQAASSLRKWSDVAWLTPWRMNTTPLGIAALCAQDPQWRPLDPGAMVTGGELVRRYFQPLAESDLLADGLHEHAEVTAVRRAAPAGSSAADEQADGDAHFQLVLHNTLGRERTAAADVIIDATGCATGPILARDSASDGIAFSAHVECGRPDPALWREVQIRIDEETGGPRGVAEALRKRNSGAAHAIGGWCEGEIGPAALITNEPNFYVLGGKSFGRWPGFMLSTGHAQIRDLFTIIGDRADLDLYRVMEASEGQPR